MKDKKLQVFVSSTFEDMKDERQAAVEAILSSGNIPAGMELFTAGDESQMTVIERWIDESDVYLLILGGRYGSIEEKSGKSYIHLEYEYALSLNKPLFSIAINREALEKKVKKNGTFVIEQDNPNDLKAFKDLVLKNLVKFYDDKKDIKLAIHETLSDFAYRKELVGWIRGDNSVNTAQLAEEIARLTKENSELRNLSLKNNNALYANLTFEELKELLENKSVFEFLLENGEQFIYGTYIRNLIYAYNGKFDIEIIEEKCNQLMSFKMLVKASGGSRLIFTEDGHNFYLKALSLIK